MNTYFKQMKILASRNKSHGRDLAGEPSSLQGVAAPARR